MASSVRALHLNDCAFVGEHLVTAGVRAGEPWRILPPAKTWAAVRQGHTAPTRIDEYRTLARIAGNVGRSQVVHVHFATTVRRLRPFLVPRRPYVLHLHGTDIRTLWADPARHATIQGAIDGAAHVFYSTLDNTENATTARSDAEYMPIFVDPAQLPQWNPSGYVAFASRWEDVKGLPAMLELAASLVAAGVDVRGLDWGPGAGDAGALGVTLVPKIDHDGFLRFLAGASIVVGQATRILSVSEVEAMAIGVPLATTGSLLPGPDGEAIPVRAGSVPDVTDAILTDLADPFAASAELGSKSWALTQHTAAAWVPRLAEVYRDVTR